MGWFNYEEFKKIRFDFPTFRLRFKIITVVIILAVVYVFVLTIIIKSKEARDLLANEQSFANPVIMENYNQLHTDGATLNGNITVRDDYTQVEWLNLKGNLNMSDSEGAKVTNMIIGENKAGEGGNLNLNFSEMKSVSENVIKGNVNLDNSSIQDFNKNVVGK